MVGIKERLQVQNFKIGLPKIRGLVSATKYLNMTHNMSHSVKDFILSLSEGVLGLTFSLYKSFQVKETLFEGETGHLLNKLIFLRSKLTPSSFDDPLTAV